MDVASSSKPERNQIGPVVRSALIVMSGMLASLVIGLARQRIVAGRFGTSAEMDAFAAANGIPELLFAMLAGGALAFAFIPIYTELLEGGNGHNSNRLFSQVVNTIAILICLVSLAVTLFAPILVRAPWGVGPHFPARMQDLTIQLMRILVLTTIIFAISSIVTGALHAHQHFLLPAITPVMYSAGIILGALVLAPKIGINGLAWGAVAGAVLHLLVQIPGLVIYRIRWQPILEWSSPRLRRVAVLMFPRVIDLLMARISIDWINANLGSSLGEGRVSALRYAFQIMNMPWTLIGTAIGIAVFPTMAALAAQENVEEQRKALSGSLRAILMLAIPAAVGLVTLGRPIIRLLFEGGEFTAHSTELVFFALQFYALTLLSQSMLEVVVRAFAAQQDTFTPLLISFFTTVLNISLAIWFVNTSLEHGGLALANGIAVGVESLAGLVILHIRWRSVDARRILLDVGRAFMAAAAMGGAILVLGTLLHPSPLMMLIGGGTVGVIVYVVLALLLGIEDIRTVPLTVLRCLGRQKHLKT